MANKEKNIQLTPVNHNQKKTNRQSEVNELILQNTADDIVVVVVNIFRKTELFWNNLELVII